MASRKEDGGNWLDLVLAMDRSMRVFADFARPVLMAHGADNLSLSNLLFLISVTGESRVNDLVKKGKYVGSNASYALKTLQENGYIDRRQDDADRRNAVVTWTPRGEALVSALRAACACPEPSVLSSVSGISTFESHCARLPGTE